MKEVKRIQDAVEKAIEALPVEKPPKALYEPISYTMALGGKRLRPVLLVLATQMAGGDKSAALSPAVGVELFHNFTLLHDDIMDAAPLRRGKPTVYKQYNTNTAILAGDVMLVMAYQYIMQVEDHLAKSVLNVFNQTATEVCEGQQYDLIYEEQETVSINEYLEMIRLKTAVLLGASMMIGGLVGGKDESLAQELYKVGEQLGLAFQMQDDILDTFGDPEKFGKQVGGDIIQNKRTYLLLTAFENANHKERRALDHWLATAGDDEQKVAAIADIFKSTGAYDDAIKRRDRYYAQAKEKLNKLDLQPEPKQLFLQLAEQLLNRDH